MEHSYDTPTRDPAEKAAAEADFPDIQGGRYRFISMLGSGGAGTVYKALDTLLDKLVAIKKLHNSANPAQAMRFQREARMAGSLKHENIMGVRDFGMTEKNEPYLVLDYVVGDSLQRRIKKGGALEPLDALSILVQVACGLEHAHKNNVIHRDIKPSNIILVESEDGDGNKTRTAKIVDFGLAKSLDDDKHDVTAIGAAIGTPTYMSPEQIKGEDVDNRTDVYSYGCLMYEMLVGVPPYKGQTTLETFDLHLNQPVRTFKEAGASNDVLYFEKVLSQCLSKKPQGRYQNLTAVLVDLESVYTKLNQDIDTSEEQNTEDIERPHGSFDLSTTLSYKDVLDKKTGKSKTALIVYAASFVSLVFITFLVWSGLTQNPSDTESSKKAKGSDVFNTEPAALSAMDDFHFDARSLLHRTPAAATDSNLKDYIDDVIRARKSSLKTGRKIDEGDYISRITVLDTEVTGKGLRYLAANAPELSLLEYGTNKFNEDHFDALASMPILEILKIHRTGAVSPIMQLQSEHMRKPDGDLDGLSKLQKMKNLKELDLVGMNLSEQHFKYIAACKKLDLLKFVNCTGVSAKNFRSLMAHSNLSLITISGTDADDATVKEACKLPGLIILELFESRTITDKCLPDVANIKRLVKFHVDNTNISRLAIEEFKEKYAKRKGFDVIYNKKSLVD